ncbi:hypothetical protein AFLA_011852 [Aspergillus flavus NRRL3357]|nr:uncharacterized protein G4B84_006974 [Aspergillus flavus NRRL3357]KAF7621555.1 hypothetical protein AFLA_011852 [Aspergillus flavus NRRL3357]QMW31593.1 hypothetical protein G4B84_006974 [Aspergillus flavus NRRL3357]
MPVRQYVLSTDSESDYSLSDDSTQDAHRQTSSRIGSVALDSPTSTGAQRRRQSYERVPRCPPVLVDVQNDTRKQDSNRSANRTRMAFIESYDSEDQTLRPESRVTEGDHDIQSSNKDITVHIDIHAALDVAPHLEQLSRLNRLGRFKEGITLFNERLARHLDFFPVVAEYADLLLEQANFRSLGELISQVLGSHAKDFEKDQVLLLKLLGSLAGMHSKGALLPALDTAKEVIKFLEDQDGEDSSDERLTGIQIQLMQTYLSIIVHASQHSLFLDNEGYESLLQSMRELTVERLSPSTYPTKKPDTDAHASYEYNSYDDPYDEWAHSMYPDDFDGPYGRAPGVNKWPPYRSRHGRRAAETNNYSFLRSWYDSLVEDGFYWDSNRLLYCTLALMGDAGGRHRLDGIFWQDLFRCPEHTLPQDEQLLLTELDKVSLLAEVSSGQLQTEYGKFHDKLSDRAQNIASSILSSAPHLVNSRPYLSWMLAETDARPQAINAGRVDPRTSHNSFISRWQHRRQIDSKQRSQSTKLQQDTLSQRTLNVIKEESMNLGDYQQQSRALKAIYRHSDYFSTCLESLQELGQLQYNVMGDMTGYLSSLIEEYFLIEYFHPPNSKPFREHLAQRLSEFDRQFPYGPDFESTAREKMDIFFFDNPLLKWMQRNVQAALLRSLDRHTEAEVAEMQITVPELHLPSYFSKQLKIFKSCAGCKDCGSTSGKTRKTYHPAEPAVPARRAMDSSSAQPNTTTYRVPLVIQSEANATEGKEEDVLHVEQMIRNHRNIRGKERKPHRRTVMFDESSTPRYTPQHSVSKDRRSEALANTAPTTIIVEDPNGKALMFPYDLCHTWKGMEDLIKQAFSGDRNALSQDIARGNYELLSEDGSIVLPIVWENLVQPGWKVKMQMKNTQPENKEMDHGDTDTANAEGSHTPENEKDNRPKSYQAVAVEAWSSEEDIAPNPRREDEDV